MESNPSEQSLLESRVADGLPIVDRIAKRLRKRLPDFITEDELVSVGRLRLVRCVERFDSARGAAFTTYIVKPIRGAMIDYLRSLDILPQQVRNTIKDGSNPNNHLGRLTSIDTDESDTKRMHDLASTDEMQDVALVRKEQIELLRSEIDQLPERPQLVLSLHYDEELTFREISRVLSLHESRISQIHSDAIKRLRQATRSV